MLNVTLLKVCVKLIASNALHIWKIINKTMMHELKTTVFETVILYTYIGTVCLGHRVICTSGGNYLDVFILVHVLQY